MEQRNYVYSLPMRGGGEVRRYYYLISYAFSTKDNRGTGTGEASTDYPITEWGDLERIKEGIRKTFDEDVTIAIMSYQLVREDSIWSAK